MQVIAAGMSLAMLGPGILRVAGKRDWFASPRLSVEAVEGPFEAIKVDGGFGTGALLLKAAAGTRVVWVLRLSGYAASPLDVDTRLLRQEDDTFVAWSHRQLFDVGPESCVYLLDQPLPADLRPGHYEIFEEAVVSGAEQMRRKLPTLSIDIAEGTGS